MSTAHNGDYCTHKDKMCMSRQEATSAAGRINGMMAYKCPACGTWHLAHKSRPLRKQKQKHSPKGRKPRTR